MNQYWWVNLGKTYRLALNDGFIWCPQRGGRTYSQALWHWENMHRVNPGDVIFANWDGAIRAIGIAETHSREASKPTSGFDFDWQSIGWRVDVMFHPLVSPLSTMSFAKELVPLREKYSPITQTGRATQSYLSEVPLLMASVLISHLSPADRPKAATDLAEPNIEAVRETEDDRHETELLARPTEPEKKGETLILIQARRGQGVFRSNLEKLESSCKVTGVRERSLLQACHIKPWRVSTTAEKVDGNNGLLLSPHVHVLFDQGFITFNERGALETAPNLNPSVQQAWAIHQAPPVTGFNDTQSEYLAFHRTNVFQAA
jgi:putative restriction endonuclease